MHLRRILASLLVLTLVFGLVIPPASAEDADNTETTSTRYFGNDRYATAVEISKAGWDKGANVIVLARGDVYADALAGVPLAYANDAPILLTTPKSLPKATKDEIVRLEPTVIYILGGIGAVSQDIEDELLAMDIDVRRIDGANRFDTAAKIALELAPDGAGSVFIAFGLNFPDALSAASYAADYGAPILLTTKDKLPAETAKALETLSPNQIFVIGGPAVISDQVLEGLDNAKRISGVDRFATSVALAERFAHKESLIFIATGNNASGGADAITGAALAAKRGTGILLVGNTLPEVVAEFLGKRIEEIIILGGNSAVSAAVAEALENAKYVPGDEVPLPPPPDPVEEPDEQSIFNISFDLPANFKADEPDTVKVTFAPEDVKDLGYNNVRFKIFSDTEGVNFQAEDQDETELDFDNSGYWGPEEGFTIAGDEEIEIDWTLNFSKRGLYKITFQLVTAETDERVLLEGSETVEVLDDIIRLVKEEVTVPSNKKITDDEKGTQNVSKVSSMTVVNETLDDVLDDAGVLFTYVGRVTDGEQGIADATVIVWYEGKYGFGCVTDENGRFEIERPYGKYQLEIRAEGYKPYFQPEITIGSPSGHDRFRNFSFGLMSGEDEYRLTQADTLETYTVRGTVFDGANNPIRNTRISVWSEETEYNAFTRTDSEGKYTLNLPEGRYYFWLSPQEHDGHITFEQIITGRIDNLDWHLPFVGLARVNVHGVLQDDKGNHLAGVYVHAWQQNGYSVSTITEQDGNYSMQLPEGPYNFYIELEGHFPIHAPNCRITADQSKMDWTLETVGEVKTISGCVKDEKGSPIPGISVFAGGIDFTYSASAVTNQEGIYTLQLPCADYVFDVYAPKYFFLPEIKQVEEDSKFDLTLKSVSKLAVVSGTVFNPDGSPAVDAQIEVAGIGNIFWGQAYTKKDGGYSISLAEGTYSFSVQSKEGYMTSGRVTVIDQDCEVDWSLVDYGSLHAVNGTVSSEEGPLPLVFVNAQCPDLDHYCFTESDLQGKFSLELYEGDYIIEYRMDGYYIETSYLTIDGAVDLGEVMLEPLGDCHDVSGTVKDKDGNPLRAEVIFSGQDIGYWKVVRTNSKGEYSATVPEGTYWIYVEAEDYCWKTLRVIIDQPKTLETIILYEPVTISGQITGPTGDTIPEAEVIAWSYEELEDHRYWEASGITDANGCYELLVTPYTEYFITIDHPTLPFMEITVAVGDEDITENIAYDPACRLEGTVTDGANPIEDVEVVFYQEWDWLGATRTDADGKYYYWVPKDQTIRIDFSHEDYWGEEKEVEVPSGDSMVVDNQVLTGVGDKYRFSGTVSSVDGPLQDVWIYVYHTAENYTVGLYTNYDGAFSFDIPMGEYRIFVYQEPYCEFRDTIAIENSSVIKDIELYLPVTLSGTVTTNGFAQEGVLVKVQQPVGDVWYLVGEEITDENGCYSFQVAPHTTYLVEFYHDPLPSGEAEVTLGAVDCVLNYQYDTSSLCQIQGTVTDGEDPIQNILVQFRAPDGSYIGSTYTDINGEYFTWIPREETIKVLFFHENYWGGELSIDLTGDTVTVEDPGLTHVGDKHTFSGTISSEEGPLPGALIFISHTSNMYSANQITEDGGAFSFELPAGEYSIEVREDSYCPYRDTIVIEDSMVKNIELLSFITLHGYVTLADERPIEGVTVQALELVDDIWRYVGGESITDELGHYSLQVVPNSTLLIEFYKDSLPYVETEITIGSSDVEFDYKYDVSCLIQGMVTDGENPIENVGVEFYSSQKDYLGSTSTDGDGKYSFWVQESQAIGVIFSHENYWGTEIEVATAGASVIVDDQVLIGVGEKYVFSGKIKSDQGTPLSGLWVHFSHLDKLYSASCRSGADGSFTFELPEGSYEIYFRSEEYGSFNGQVEITCATENYEIIMSPLVYIRGQVVCGDTPVSGVVVWADSDVHYERVVTGEDGTFELRVAPNQVYELTFTHEDYWGETIDSVTVSGEDYVLGDVSLTHVGARFVFSGTVKSDKGIPLSGVIIMASHHDHEYHASQYLELDGSFSLLLPVGSYTIFVEDLSRQHGIHLEDVKIEDAYDDVQFILKTLVTLSGTVKDEIGNLLSGVTVWPRRLISEEDGHEWYFLEEEVETIDGYFELKVASNSRYSIRFSLEGYYDKWDIIDIGPGDCENEFQYLLEDLLAS